MKLLKVVMLDRSIFTMPNEIWQKAFDIKYGDNEGLATERFKEITKHHWDNRTVPTKFGTDMTWEKEYKTQAELGEDVMYVYIRAALLAVAMEEMAKRAGQKVAPRVLALEKDGSVTEYTGHSRKKTTLEDALEEKEVKE